MPTRSAFTKPQIIVSLLTLAGAVLAERQQSSPQMVQLTDLEGEVLLVRPDQVFVVHPSTVRVRTLRGTELQVLGLKDPLQVRETPREVITRLGGTWACLHVPGSWLGLGESEVEAFVDASQVVTVEPSPYRLNISRRKLTDVLLAQGYKLQVVEDVPTVARLLGM